MLSVVYASPTLGTCLLFWEHPCSFASSHCLSWTLIGDFNEVVNSSKKFEAALTNQSRLFTDFLDSCHFMDLGFEGPQFTWIGKYPNGGIILERLNKALCNWEWGDRFPAATVTHLTITRSDHAPILLNLNHPIQHRPTNPSVLNSADSHTLDSVKSSIVPSYL